MSYDRSTIGKLNYLVQFPLSDISTVSSDQLKGSVTLTTTQNLFLEDIHLILFLPKISCASTKLSTQLSETVEEPFSSDITRTHHYNSAILNNVARSSALGTTLRDVCVVCVSMSTGSVFVTRHFQNLGKNAKQADTKHLCITITERFLAC